MRRVAPLVKRLWLLSWPAVLQLFALSLVLTADRLALSGEGWLAPLQLASLVAWVSWSSATALATGVSVSVARALGQADPERATWIAWLSTALLAVLGLALGALLLAFGQRGLALLFPGASPQTLAGAWDYLARYGWVLPLVFAERSAVSALQAQQDTRTPFAASLAASLAHLSLLAVLVVLPAPERSWGLAGAAVAIGSATAVSLLLCLRALALSPHTGLARLWATMAAGNRAPGAMAEVASVALPAFISRMAIDGGFVASVMLIGLLGDAAMAANQAVMAVEVFFCHLADGVAVGAAALSAHAFGGRRIGAQKRVLSVAPWLAVLPLSLGATLLFALGAPLLGLFSLDAAALKEARVAMLLAALALPLVGYVTVLRASLLACGRERQVLVVTLCSTLLLRLPLGYLAAFQWHLGLGGIWGAMAIDWAAQAIALRRVAHAVRSAPTARQRVPAAPADASATFALTPGSA